MAGQVEEASGSKPLGQLRERSAAAIRCLILLTVFLMTKYQEDSHDPQLDYFLMGAAGYVLFTTLLLPRLCRPAEMALPQLVLDVLVITGLIYVQGGIKTEYYLLYYLHTL